MPALHHGHLAYIPTMVVQRHTITNLLQTDGIKMAGQRFVERTLPFAVSFLQSTITITTLVITREHTIFSVDNAGDQIAVLIRINNPLPVDHSLRRSRQPRPYHRKASSSSATSSNSTGAPASPSMQHSPCMHRGHNKTSRSGNR